VLKLSVSPRRNNNSSRDHGYVDEDDEISLPTPYASAPSSPRRAFSKEIVEAPLGEVLAAIPFAWELVPGTPKLEPCVSSDETVSSQDAQSSDEFTEFEFSSRWGSEEPRVATAPAEELFANGQLVTSLRLPPRLQHLRNSDSSCSDVSDSPGGSFKSYSPPQGSPRLALCGFTKTTDDDTTILGMQERKHRSLSPLRFFHENLFSSESSSNSSSSSSSSSRSPQDSPDGSSLLFIDMDMASETLKPRQVQSKKDQESQENIGRPALTPQLSRSNARSRCVCHQLSHFMQLRSL
jgi:hypothetical protein